MKQSHIIFVCADQLRYDVLGKGYTPYLDQLAHESITFENAYCASPLCVPARGSMFTGMCPNTTGSLINPWEEADAAAGYVKKGIRNLYEIMEDNGWDCIHSGKQHLFVEGTPLEHRPDTKTQWLTTEQTYKDYLKANGKPMPGGPSFRCLVPEMLGRTKTIATTCSNANTGCYEPGENFYFDGYFAEAAVRGLKERDLSKPVFLSAMFLAPHPPFQIPDPWFSKYAPYDVTLPENVGNWYPHQSPLQLYNVTGALGSHYTKEEWHESWRTYLGLVSLLDHCVGQIIDELKRQDIYKDCLFIFTSDHGEMLGSHRLFQKMCMYQESARVPLYLHLPGMTADETRSISDNVSHIDLLPTLCKYLGIEPELETEGRSLLPLLDGACKLPPRPVFIQYDGNACLGSCQRCVVDGSMKLIVDTYHEEFFFELYNKTEDPQEMKNLLFEEGYMEEGCRLFRLLLDHMAASSDSASWNLQAYDNFIQSSV